MRFMNAKSNLRAIRILLLLCFLMNFVLLAPTITSNAPTVGQRIVRAAYDEAIFWYQVPVAVFTLCAVALLSIEIRRA